MKEPLSRPPYPGDQREPSGSARLATLAGPRHDRFSEGSRPDVRWPGRQSGGRAGVMSADD